MKRRDFLGKAALGTLAAGAVLSGCNDNAGDTATTASNKSNTSTEVIKWKMVTTWPKNFPGLGTGANNLAEKINTLSAGRMEVKVYGAGELVPALEIFDTVSRGTAQMGHGAAYYWKGKNEVFQFFSTVPFGLTAQEMNGWLYNGGGLDLWQKAYAKHNIIPMPAGNMGVQMGGWFNKEINSLADLKGLKMRIPGLGGEVFKRAGGTPVNLPGGELFTAMQSGTIDAVEWVGPYNDLAFGFHKVAKFYYYPGWHEPGTTLEAMINKQAFEALPKDLQAIVKTACEVANHEMLAEYTSRNNDALQTLVNKHQVQVRRFPDEVLEKLRDLSDQVVKELAQKDAFATEVYESFSNYRDKAVNWSEYSERAYLNVRAAKTP
jgi:TRAP-type mannitol/chloroaromatic compound transport system substrate-binding protein